MENTENRIMGALCYLSVFVLIPILIAERTSFIRHHANQGIVLCGAGIICKLIMAIFGKLFLVGFLITIVIKIVMCIIFLFSLAGLIAALMGKTVDLPVISQIKIL